MSEPDFEEIAKSAAETWVFETNGHRWSNNDDTAGDNYGSFLAGFIAGHLAGRVTGLEEAADIAEKCSWSEMTISGRMDRAKEGREIALFIHERASRLEQEAKGEKS